MGYDLTVQGLIRKRAELAGSAESLRAQLGDQLSALDHIDAVIRVFRPDIDLADLPARPAPPALSGTRGEFQRFLLDQLRKADRPLTTFDLAEAVMRERGLNLDDRVTVKLMRHRTGYAMAKLRSKGTVTSKRGHHSAVMQWTLAQNA